ncbi:MAG: sulfatase-like hydrolase/transferase, partial [Verrucomicrobiota bacterium]
LPQLLKEAGYRTGLFGKWHLGKYEPYQPQERGFDEFFGHYHGHIERYEFPDQVYHNGTPVEARGYVTDVFTDAAIDFIDYTAERTDQPFFCALMYNAPHSPFLLDTGHYGQPEGDRVIERYLEKGLPLREARIYGMIERIDQNVGRLVERLAERGLLENTILVFTSDNGGVSKYWKGGMNGQKSSAYEGGVRAPCFVQWTGQIPEASIISGQTSHVDWLPTFCELAGVSLPDDRLIDGRSLATALRLGAAQEHHPYVYHTWDRYFPNPDRRWGISDQRWKLMAQFGSDAEPSRSGWRLFDLENDPGETRNLREKHPEIVDRLRVEFERWFADVTAGQRYAPIPIPVDGTEATSIEPSWATWAGDGIEYVFDGYDWDTIEGWRAPGEKATWQLDVKASGTYAVTLRYGCRPLDAGGKARISVKESALEFSIEATTTGEQFGLFEIGKIELPQGKTELSIEVLECRGEELMKLNEVLLRPVAELE